MNWSPQQDRALAQVSAWMRDESRQVFRLFGFAGTGKTTLAKHLVANANRHWLFAAFTGKAAHVLRTKGCENASTIHSLIYRPAGQTKEKETAVVEQRAFALSAKINDMELGSDEWLEANRALEGLHLQLKLLQSESETRYAVWACSLLADSSVDGVVIDECSMVDTRIGEDLLSFGKKILVLGDPAQLPPVGSGGFFTNHEPNALLTEVHRHARESGILRLATAVREGHPSSQKPLIWGEDCRVLDDVWLNRDDKQKLMLAADQVIVGRNRTRLSFNRAMRTLLGKTQVLEPGDRMICLKNDRELGIYNGSQWLVQSVDEVDVAEKTATLSLKSEDDPGQQIVAPIWLHHVLGEKEQLEEMGWDRLERTEFDHSYAVTCHKSQGSQWPSVVVCDESAAFRGHARRWLYTAVTRASNRLTVLL